MLTFIELPLFARFREAYLDDDELAGMQAYLSARPETGDLIPGSGGCRKLRWRGSGRGKRGGLRVIYFWRRSDGQIVLVTLYAKNVTDNIAPATLRTLKEAFDDKA